MAPWPERRYLPVLICSTACAIRSIHGLADVLVGLRDALGVEILAHLAEHVVVAGLLEVGHHDLLRVGVGGGAGHAHFFRRPQAEQLVAPGIRLEAQLLIMRELLLEAFLALVERRHVALVVVSNDSRRNRVWMTEPVSSYGLCALCTTGQGASRQSTGAELVRCARKEVGLCRLYCPSRSDRFWV